MNLRKAYPAFVAVLVALLAFGLGLPSGADARGLPHFCQVPSAGAVVKNRSKGTLPSLGPGTKKAMLLVNHSTVPSGGTVYARIANFSSVIVGFGLEFQIEERLSGSWQVDPASPPGPWPQKRGRIQPGAAGSCYVFEVPADHSPGELRFSTVIEGLQGAAGRSARKYAQFTVG